MIGASASSWSGSTARTSRSGRSTGLNEARLREAKLLAVHTWTYQFTAGPGYLPGADPEVRASIQERGWAAVGRRFTVRRTEPAGEPVRSRKERG